MLRDVQKSGDSKLRCRGFFGEARLGMPSGDTTNATEHAYNHGTVRWTMDPDRVVLLALSPEVGIYHDQSCGKAAGTSRTAILLESLPALKDTQRNIRIVQKNLKSDLQKNHHLHESITSHGAGSTHHQHCL